MKISAGLASYFYRPVLLIIFFILLASRRWEQLVSPQVWDEDGRDIIYGFIHYGWSEFLTPVNGYLITLPKMITALSLEVSFLYYPLVSTVLAWVFILLVGLAVALSPTKLKYKCLCALSIFVIPSDPEVFGLPQYTFWWVSLLLFLVILWDERRNDLCWRMFFLIIGGLSSPVIILISPILYFRVYMYRQYRAEVYLAFVATVLAFIQLLFMIGNSAGQIQPLGSIVLNVVPTFFGMLLAGNMTEELTWLWFLGTGLILLIAYSLIQDRYNIIKWILIYLLIGSVALSVARVDPVDIHTSLVGPRYFFFPFILIYWNLIQIFEFSQTLKIRGILLAVITIISTMNAVPAWSRQHTDLHWAAHVYSCVYFPQYIIPVHYDGRKYTTWSLRINGETCSELLDDEWMHILLSENKKPVYAYTRMEVSLPESVPDLDAGTPMIISSTIAGSDYEKTSIDGYNVTGTFVTSDQDMGEMVLRLHRGDRLMYRSGPDDGGQSMIITGHEHEYIQELPIAEDWTILEFSNISLPDEFFLKITDQGQGWGQWFSVAIKM